MLPLCSNYQPILTLQENESGTCAERIRKRLIFSGLERFNRTEDDSMKEPWKIGGLLEDQAVSLWGDTRFRFRDISYHCLFSSLRPRRMWGPGIPCAQSGCVGFVRYEIISTLMNKRRKGSCSSSAHLNTTSCFFNLECNSSKAGRTTDWLTKW